MGACKYLRDIDGPDRKRNCSRPVCCGLPLRLDEVPQIAVEVGEHSNGAVGFMPWRLLEDDAFGLHGRMVTGEVVGLQEEENAAAGLVADPRALLGILRLGE